MAGGNHTDGSTVLADMQSVETDPKRAKIATRNVRKCQVGPRRQNSPYRLKIKTPKRPRQQNHVSIDGNNIHALHNMPIEALGMRNQRIAFGRLASIWLSLSLKVLEVVIVSGVLMGWQELTWAVASYISTFVSLLSMRDLEDFRTALITNHDWYVPNFLGT